MSTKTTAVKREKIYLNFEQELYNIERNASIKKLAPLNKAIEELESAIAIVETRMATVEGAADMSLYEQHQKLKMQLDRTVEEWEQSSIELDEMKTNG